MELAATVVLLLKTLIGEVQTMNERLGPSARDQSTIAPARRRAHAAPASQADLGPATHAQ